MAKLGKSQVGLVILWALSLLVGWRPLVDTFALSVNNDAYTHILLILPISSALIYLEWRCFQSMFATSLRIGSALLVTAVLIACPAVVWSASLPPDIRLSIRMFALVLWWIGAFVLCFGFQASRRALFPLLFLFGLVPFPQVVVNRIVALLQLGSSWAAHLLFIAFGVPVTQDGFDLTIPGLTVQVAVECSSIRSSSMLLVTTMVLAQLLLRSPWKKALLICLAVPLSVAKNGLRVFSIAMLGTRVDRGYLTGRFHHQGGIVFFAVALIAIFASLWVLRKGEASAQIVESDSVKAVPTEA